MPPDLRTATERVMEVRARVADLSPTEASLREIEDVLTDGYALALAGDAWSTRSERRLHELIAEGSLRARGRELRALGIEHGGFQRRLIALRDELADLQREYAHVQAAARMLQHEEGAR